MNTEGNAHRHSTRMLKRTQNDRNCSSLYTDSSSSSDEELAPRNNKLVPNLVLPGSNRKACSLSKSTTNNSFKRRACKKTLIKDYKVQCQYMLATFKKDLRNVAAANSTVSSTKNRGRHMPNTNQAQVQKSPHSGKQTLL